MLKTLFTVAVIAFLAGCTPTPTIQQGADAELTFDGLGAHV
jgi:uncharacterized lipoprotein YajG